MTKANPKWEKLLTPEIARGKLISASLYLTAYDLLKASIIDRIRSFYTFGSDAEDPADTEYKKKVLNRNKSPLYASLDWLRECGALSECDLQTFEIIKATRNSLAHGLVSLVMGDSDFKHIDRFQELVALLRKIEVWWVINFEIATNPEYDDKEIDEERIVPGAVLMLQMMLEVVSGNETFLNHYKNKASQG